MTVYTVSSRQVVSEIIDGEAVILDLRLGRYYTTDGVGAEVWRAATAGVARNDIMASCRASFPDEPSVDHDVDSLLDSLVGAGLLNPQNVSVVSDNMILTWPAEYRAPELSYYDDLADMMALDPIHDVDASGWPAPGPLAG